MVVGIHEACKTFLAGLQGFVAEIDGASIVRLEDEEADGHRRISLREQFVATVEEFVERNEVAQRLAHLLSVDGDHVVVHPIMYHVVALRGYGLGNLALVMREDQIHAAAMYIEMAAQVFPSHSRTFAMPAGESVAPRRWPAHDVLGLRAFPECEVDGVMFFVLAIECARRIQHLVDVATR